MRYELQVQQAPAPGTPEADVPAPVRSREAISTELDRVRAALAEARSSADRLDGQLHAAGDPAVLRASAEDLAARKERLETEYSASGWLWRHWRGPTPPCRTASLLLWAAGQRRSFSRLTDNRYAGVVLDRSFRLSAEPVGDPVFRDAALLSAGALDQLYLAVRLAICELVSPPEKQVPIVLDDALANFDDSRAARPCSF